MDGRSTLKHREWPNDSLLGRLRERSRDALIELGTPIAYQARQLMIRQGEQSRYALLMLSGCAKVLVSTEFDRDVLIAVRGAGHLLGEMAILDGRSRPANVIAAVPVTATLIKGADLAQFIERHTDVCLTVAQITSEHLRRADRRCVELVACPAPTRVGRVLAEILQRYGAPTPGGWDLGVPLNQAEIASLAGVALTTVEKTLQTMRNGGVLRTCCRRLVVTDVTRLLEFAGLDDQNPY